MKEYCAAPLIHEVTDDDTFLYFNTLMIPFIYGLQLINKVLQTVTETATDFPEYVQVIQAKIQHVSTKEERLVVRQYELELINLIRDEIDVGCPYQVFVTVGASVDFVVLSRSNTPIVLKGHTASYHDAAHHRDLPRTHAMCRYRQYRHRAR